MVEIMKTCAKHVLVLKLNTWSTLSLTLDESLGCSFVLVAEEGGVDDCSFLSPKICCYLSSEFRAVTVK